MKAFIILSALVAVTLAAPHYTTTPGYANVHVVKEELTDNDSLHNTHFSYEQSDGQYRNEAAELRYNERQSRSEEESSVLLRVTGSYGWVDPVTGQKYTIQYVADENGFQPQGAHIPA